MNKTFRTLFTLFLGILFFIPTFTANSKNLLTDKRISKTEEKKCIPEEKTGFQKVDGKLTKKTIQNNLNTSLPVTILKQSGFFSKTCFQKLPDARKSLWEPTNTKKVVPKSHIDYISMTSTDFDENQRNFPISLLCAK